MVSRNDVITVPPPVLGFNNNVRHRGRIFHIQTEDSGVRNHRIVSHLFADGGRIIKTIRTDYAEHVERPDMTNVVRQMMKAQHKAMFSALRAGELDALLEAACGPLPLPLARDSGSMSVVSVSLPVATPVQTEPLSAASAPSPASASATTSTEPADRGDVAPTGVRQRPLSNPNLRKLVPSIPPPTVEAVERAVASLDPLTSDTPSTVRSSAKPTEQAPRPRKSNPTATRKTRSERPTLSRPASRYGSAPSKSSQSIFGDGVISEKSLDEVILSYLADDLEGSSE